MNRKLFRLKLTAADGVGHQAFAVATGFFEAICTLKAALVEADDDWSSLTLEVEEMGEATVVDASEPPGATI